MPFLAGSQISAVQHAFTVKHGNVPVQNNQSMPLDTVNVSLRILNFSTRWDTCSASRSGRLFLKILHKLYATLKAGVDMVARRKFSTHYWESNSDIQCVTNNWRFAKH
jgi:hypothetical protein